MTQIDYDREMAFVAVREAATRSASPGWCASAEAPRREFAIIVDPPMKGKGLAPPPDAAPDRLGALARRSTAIVGQVLADNAPMLAFVRRPGLRVIHCPGVRRGRGRTV